MTPDRAAYLVYWSTFLSDEDRLQVSADAKARAEALGWTPGKPRGAGGNGPDLLQQETTSVIYEHAKEEVERVLRGGPVKPAPNQRLKQLEARLEAKGKGR